MERKEWLENFIRCVDSGMSTLDFRRYCRVKAQHLPRYMAQLQSFRDELARLIEDERDLELREKRLASLEEARRVRTEQRLAAIEVIRISKEREKNSNSHEVIETESLDDNNVGETNIAETE